MRDLLAAVSLEERLIDALPEEEKTPDWSAISGSLEERISASKAFLNENIY